MTYLILRTPWDCASRHSSRPTAFPRAFSLGCCCCYRTNAFLTAQSVRSVFRYHRVPHSAFPPLLFQSLHGLQSTFFPVIPPEPPHCPTRCADAPTSPRLHSSDSLPSHRSYLLLAWGTFYGHSQPAFLIPAPAPRLCCSLHPIPNRCLTPPGFLYFPPFFQSILLRFPPASRNMALRDLSKVTELVTEPETSLKLPVHPLLVTQTHSTVRQVQPGKGSSPFFAALGMGQVQDPMQDTRQ